MAKKEDITVKESGFKVGDILVGQTHMYRTITYWYEIIRVTEKRLELRELPVAYPTAYRSNTPGDHCMPVLNVKGNWFIPNGYPYTDRLKENEPVKGKAMRLTYTEVDLPFVVSTVYLIAFPFTGSFSLSLSV